MVQTLDSGVGWGWGNLHGNGDGEFFCGDGVGMGIFHGDGENFVGMGTILFTVSLSNQCPMTSAISLLNSVTRKCRVTVEIFSLCALELEICLRGIFTPSSPLPANVAKKPLPGEGLKIQYTRINYQMAV